ncbi:Mediator of RNA polymerase II transcription subunit 32 [Dendrobium catenatum]|uniref:Mediator of RNA polymerase II transcription subunit 32 n=1 Tax=Dendrobium catenatum TaxID=906689 RepID=A0A2I0WDP0_9ASPA|nr:Mediator of RNA polymerase II transcription subunit 32 [Dendrobium catenatum]
MSIISMAFHLMQRLPYFVLRRPPSSKPRISQEGKRRQQPKLLSRTFRARWNSFRVACDQAEEFVESLKQRIGSECLVDEATGATTVKIRTALCCRHPSTRREAGADEQGSAMARD